MILFPILVASNNTNIWNGTFNFSTQFLNFRINFTKMSFQLLDVWIWVSYSNRVFEKVLQSVLTVIKISQLPLVTLSISFDLYLTRITLNWISRSFISWLVFRVILLSWFNFFCLNFFISRSLYFIVISEFSFRFAVFLSVFFDLFFDFIDFFF